MLLIIRPLSNCRHVSFNFMPKFSLMYSSSPRQKSIKIRCMKKPARISKDGYERIGTIPTVPLVDENIACEIQKDLRKVEMSEWTPVIVDYAKLHEHYLKLSKIKLTTLVVATTMAGYAFAPAPFDFHTFVMCSLGTGLVSATANTINQFFEVPFDAQMSRTKNRVLVRGRLTSVHAVAFAMITGIIGLSVLYCEVNGIAAALGASNLLLYTLVYTPMKRISIVNTWVGSVVGAIPPLMGWAGCTGDIFTPDAWILPGILYAWQFPHFNALSWNLRKDYSRAGYRMMAVTNPNLCRRTTMRYTVVLTTLCYVAPLLDVTHWWFALASTPINVSFLYLAWKFNKHSDSANSRKLFRFSLLHLPLLMMLMFSSKKYRIDTEKQGDMVESSYNESAKKNDLLTIFTTTPIATSSV